MVQAHVFISGNVQGVGYRYFVRTEARKQGITGWVRNTEDGGVEAVLQYSAPSEQDQKKQIEALIALCKKGPFLAEVKQIGYEWESIAEPYSTFSIQ